MPNSDNDYLDELAQCWKRFDEAMNACCKQLRIAHVHSGIAREKIKEAEYFACDMQHKLNTASDCIDSISSEPY